MQNNLVTLDIDLLDNSTKSGQCPVPVDGGIGLCIEDCKLDTDCRDNLKCCSNGCGHQCIEPFAGTFWGNYGAGLTWHNWFGPWLELSDFWNGLMYSTEYLYLVYSENTLYTPDGGFPKWSMSIIFAWAGLHGRSLINISQDHIPFFKFSSSQQFAIT